MEKLSKVTNKVLIITNQKKKLQGVKAFCSDFLFLITPEELKEEFNLITEAKVVIDASFVNEFFTFLQGNGLIPSIDSEIGSEYIVAEDVRVYKGTDDLSIFMRSVNALKFKFTDFEEEEQTPESFHTIIVKGKKDEMYYLVDKIPKDKDKNKKYITIRNVEKMSRVFDIVDSIEE